MEKLEKVEAQDDEEQNNEVIPPESIMDKVKEVLGEKDA